jgi:hypothetical protein
MVMNTPDTAHVDEATANALTSLALGNTDILQQTGHLREMLRQSSGLDGADG